MHLHTICHCRRHRKSDLCEINAAHAYLYEIKHLKYCIIVLLYDLHEICLNAMCISRPSHTFIHIQYHTRTQAHKPKRKTETMRDRAR